MTNLNKRQRDPQCSAQLAALVNTKKKKNKRFPEVGLSLSKIGGDSPGVQMPDPLMRAIRCRDRDQAFAILDQMRGHLPSATIHNRIIAAVEYLAWEEGDRAAASWILRHAGRLEILSSQ